MLSLKGRSLLTLKEFSAAEILHLLDLAAGLKRAKREGSERQHLRGKEIALIFEKDSTRTRVGFEVAAYDQGAHVTYLGPTGTQMGHKESVKDTARVLGRVYDAIEFRGFAHESAELLAQHAGVPVYNGLTDRFHPTQALADLFTMREHSARPLRDVSCCFIGDIKNNVASSLLVGGVKMGMDMRLCGPRACWPSEDVVTYANEAARETGARVQITGDPAAAMPGCDFIHTDVWVSMGEADTMWKERIALLAPYQVNRELMAMTGKRDTKFMHCLPAFHNTETKTGQHIQQSFGLDCMEVTEDVFESPASIVFDQAENRMHTIKALLVATIGS